MIPSPEVSATPHITERDAVMRERRAFSRGAIRWAEDRGMFMAEIQAESERTFPLPKVTRPRVVADPHGDGKWTTETAFGMDNHPPCIAQILRHETVMLPIQAYATAERVALWADLLANPTEEVEDGS